VSMEPFGQESTSGEVRSDTYTMADAARLKGVSYHTVSRAVRRGTLPAQRIGKMAFISAADLQAWHPMVQRAPRKYRRRMPELDAMPSTIDLASAERVVWAQQIATLIETTRWATQGMPIDDHLELLTERLGETLGMHRVTVWRIEESRGTANRAASYGPPAGDFPNEVPLALFPLIADLAARHHLGGRVPAVDDTALRQSTTILVLPLRFGCDIHGALIADQDGSTFTLSDDQLVLAKTIADQISIALELDSRRRDSLVSVN